MSLTYAGSGSRYRRSALPVSISNAVKCPVSSSVMIRPYRYGRGVDKQARLRFGLRIVTDYVSYVVTVFSQVRAITVTQLRFSPRSLFSQGVHGKRYTPSV